MLARLFAKRCRILFVAGPLGGDEIQAPPGYDFRALTDDDFRRGRLFGERGRMEKFLGRLKERHRCYGYVDGTGEPVSYLWYTPPDGRAPWALGIGLNTGEGRAYIWDCRTAPAEGGRQLYPSALQKLRRMAGAEGIGQLYIDCEPENGMSIRGIERAGFVYVRRMCAVRLGWLRLFRSGGSWPRWNPDDIYL